MTKRALIIAPTYGYPYTLPPTPNDRADWLATLAARGFTSISVIQGQTSASVMAALSAFSNSLLGGDRGAVVALGHGSRLPGSEPDGYDECYVPPDLQAIRDHEIGQILLPALNRGAKVDVVSEFCYAGTSTDDMLRTWCGCGPAQTVWWGYSGGLVRSLFSLYLCYALRNYPAYTASQLMQLVRGWVMGAVPSQVPQLDGPGQSEVPF
jgi:hypothetical protein